MNFSKTASYSLNVLSYMATHGDENMSAAFLHEKLAIPYPYLRQILNESVKKRIYPQHKGKKRRICLQQEKGRDLYCRYY